MSPLKNNFCQVWLFPFITEQVWNLTHFWKNFDFWSVLPQMFTWKTRMSSQKNMSINDQKHKKNMSFQQTFLKIWPPSCIFWWDSNEYNPILKFRKSLENSGVSRKSFDFWWKYSPLNHLLYWSQISTRPEKLNWAFCFTNILDLCRLHYVWFSKFYWHFCKSIIFAILHPKGTLNQL